MFRYNLRKMRDDERFNLSLSQVTGRLKYKTLIEPKGNPQENEQITFFPIMDIFHGKKRRILQIKNGKIVGRYPTIVMASYHSGVGRTNIRKVLSGDGQSSGGYEWKYE